jgi:hypothetical protein
MREIVLKIPKSLFDLIKIDLQRPHSHAFERIGFIGTKYKKLNDGTILIFAVDYFPVDDENYIEDEEVGARINSDAIRKAMQYVLDSGNGCFHVHYHSFSYSIPQFSATDLTDNPEIVKSFTYVHKEQFHGMLVIGNNSSNALVQIPETTFKLKTVTKIVVVGYPMNFSFLKNLVLKFDNERFDRQSFLGENSQFLLSKVRIGIIGVGGGGSHIIQQLSHIGILNYSVFEFDKTDKTNLNRLIGAGLEDAKESKAKTDIALEMIQKLNPNADIRVFGKWQENPEEIQKCDIVVGGVDSFLGRRDLEAECRRFMVPYIDLGMDVHNDYEGEPPSMSGQVILSMPEFPCMTCMGFLNDQNLSKEAAKYGKAGGKPQVVWSNGVLASTAIGLMVDLITGWTKQQDKLVYIAYDGNKGVLENHVRLKFIENKTCDHFHLKNVGPPKFCNI